MPISVPAKDHPRFTCRLAIPSASPMRMRRLVRNPSKQAKQSKQASKQSKQVATVDRCSCPAPKNGRNSATPFSLFLRQMVGSQGSPPQRPLPGFNYVRTYAAGHKAKKESFSF